MHREAAGCQDNRRRLLTVRARLALKARIIIVHPKDAIGETILEQGDDLCLVLADLDKQMRMLCNESRGAKTEFALGVNVQPNTGIVEGVAEGEDRGTLCEGHGVYSCMVSYLLEKVSGSRRGRWLLQCLRSFSTVTVPT
jgi:hypothetical protein